MAGKVMLYAYKLLASSGSPSGSNSNPSNPGSASVPWHLSVFVFGYEISYGMKGISITERSSLVQTPDETVDMGTMVQTPDETVDMGTTLRTRAQLCQFVKDLRRNWTEGNYNALTHNCTMFAEEILSFLQINKTIPYKYTEVQGHARTGATYVGYGIAAALIGAILPYIVTSATNSSS